LFVALTALKCFRMRCMCLCFSIKEQTGLVDQENLIFMLHSLAIVSEFLLTPLILSKRLNTESPRNLTKAVPGAIIALWL
jgi:hypothetical protein